MSKYSERKNNVDSSKTRQGIFLSCLVIMAIVIQIVALTSIADEKRANKEQEALLYGQSLASSIRLTLEQSVDSTETVKYFYQIYGDECFKDFDQIAREIMDSNPAVGSVYIAPKGVIRVAYPASVRKATLGFAVLEDKYQGPRARLAVDTRKTTVAGPHWLIEGGKGFIIRTPMFDGDEFLGLSVVVLDWESFVQQVLENTSSSSEHYKFAVWKNAPDETAITDEDGYILRNSDKLFLIR